MAPVTRSQRAAAAAADAVKVLHSVGMRSRADRSRTPPRRSSRFAPAPAPVKRGLLAPWMQQSVPPPSAMPVLQDVKPPIPSHKSVLTKQASGQQRAPVRQEFKPAKWSQGPVLQDLTPATPPYKPEAPPRAQRACGLQESKPTSMPMPLLQDLPIVGSLIQARKQRAQMLQGSQPARQALPVLQDLAQTTPNSRASTGRARAQSGPPGFHGLNQDTSAMDALPDFTQPAPFLAAVASGSDADCRAAAVADLLRCRAAAVPVQSRRRGRPVEVSDSSKANSARAVEPTPIVESIPVTRLTQRSKLPTQPSHAMADSKLEEETMVADLKSGLDQPRKARKLAVVPFCSPAAAAKEIAAGTLLERASSALTPGGLCGGRLPCRDTEQDRILRHLRTGVKQGGSEQVLYISGMPGTGKTAAFLSAIQQVEDELPIAAAPFVFVHTNAMRLATPNAIFGEILRHLKGGGHSSAAAAQSDIQRFLCDRRKSNPVVVLLIDEIDQLVTRNQAVLYSVFEWLSMRGRLVVAAISNTMDLPERMLPRVASRFEIVRVDFWPYTRDQLQSILTERLRRHDALTAFTPDSLKRCSARVAAGSGDVRKALQLCRRAAEIRSKQCLQKEGPAPLGPVEGVHLDAAAQDILYANPAANAIAGLSSKTRKLLVAVLVELRAKENSDTVELRQVAVRYERLIDICSARSELPSSSSHAEDACALAERLVSMSLLCQHTKGVGVKGPSLTLGSGLDTEDLAKALLNAEEDAGMKNLIKN